eukprot:COSAG01_NODE_10303_length_2197_cov_11.641986_1_plen_183_part_00
MCALKGWGSLSTSACQDLAAMPGLSAAEAAVLQPPFATRLDRTLVVRPAPPPRRHAPNRATLHRRQRSTASQIPRLAVLALCMAAQRSEVRGEMPRPPRAFWLTTLALCLPAWAAGGGRRRRGDHARGLQGRSQEGIRPASARRLCNRSLTPSHPYRGQLARVPTETAGASIHAVIAYHCAQ